LYRKSSLSISQPTGVISLAEDDFQLNSAVLIPERAPSTQSINGTLDIPPCQSLEREEYKESHGCPRKWYFDECFTSPKLCDWFLWFGSEDDIAVYSKQENILGKTVSDTYTRNADSLGEEKSDSLPDLQELTIDEILQALRGDEVDRDGLATHMFDSIEGRPPVWASYCREQLRALDTLYTAFKLYEGLSDALVDLRVTSPPLSKAQWAQEKASDAKLLHALLCSSLVPLTLTHWIFLV
jgi:hypothetical protein